MRSALRLLSGVIAALDHRLIAPNLLGSGETISITRSWRVGRGFVKRRATPSLRNLLAGIRWPRSIPSKTARNRFTTLHQEEHEATRRAKKPKALKDRPPSRCHLRPGNV